MTVHHNVGLEKGQNNESIEHSKRAMFEGGENEEKENKWCAAFSSKPH